MDTANTTWDELREELYEGYTTDEIAQGRAELNAHMAQARQDNAEAVMNDLAEEDVAACPYMTYAGSYYDQPEYCDRELEDGRTHCGEHQKKIDDLAAWEARMDTLEANAA